MKPEQKVGIIFSVFGAAMGIFSTLIGMLALAFIVPIAGYVAMLFAISRLEKTKKMKWVVANSVMSFVMVWFIVWIFAFNAW